MKKQILTLTVCLAFTASTAFAVCPVKSTTAPKTSKNCPCAVPAPGEQSLTKEQMKQKFEEKMTKRREAFYNELGLTKEQRAKAIEMDNKNRAEAKPLMEKMQQEKAKLNDLTSKNACPAEILKQKKELKTARKALREHFKTSRKNFEAILTKEQLAKLETMKAERKAKMKKHCKCKGPCHCEKKPMFDMENPQKK